MSTRQIGLLAAVVAMAGILAARPPLAAEPAAMSAAPTGAAATPVVPAGPPGKAEILEVAYAAGTVAQGTDISHAFTIKNVGQHPLTVDAKPGCGCTVAEFDKLIAPGSSGKVTATVRTANFKGPITKSITVSTNDPDHASVMLQISADISVPFEVLPSDTVSFMGRYDELTPQEVTIFASDAAPFDVTSATVRDGGFKVTVVAAPETGTAGKPKPGTVASGANRYKVTIAPPPEPKVGMTVTQLLVKTTHAKAAEIPLRVFANVSGDVTFSPPTVMLQTGAAATPDQKQATILLQKLTGDALKILGVTSDDPSLETSSKTVEAGRNYEITVKYVGAPLTTVLNSKVSVQTNDRRQPTVAIPVWGRTEGMPQGVVSTPPATAPEATTMTTRPASGRTTP
jgi:hypothetical protein